MKQVSRSALVSFSAEQMFHLVNDVARYPEFLPGCSGSCVLEQSEAHMVASVDVSKAGISKTFYHLESIDARGVDCHELGGWAF
ncbi:SRPBCC family protein [Vibrio cholerae]